MKLNQVLFSVLLVCFACTVVYSIETNNVASKEDIIETKTRDGLAVPKLFDFERFKNIFKKSYGTIMEELARKRIFLGRAIRAFVSFVGYKHYKTDSYLKVNEMSDWTLDEHRKILKRNPLANMKVTIVDESDQSKLDLENTPVADMKDIEEKLNELSKREEFANEMVGIKNNNKNRRKRELEGENIRSSLTLDHIAGNQVEQVDVSEHIPSNNPDYQIPELSSYGDEDDSSTPMEVETTNIIASLPGARFVGSLFTNLFGGTTDYSSSYSAPAKQNRLPNEVFVDHRQCFSEVKNQAQCGSCYVFSTTALYEWQFCHESGKKVSFSEQYVLDCSGGRYKKPLGCGGGLEVDVASFFGWFGVELRSNYPYRQRSDVCPYDAKTNTRRMGYLRLLTDDDGGMLGVKYPYLQKYLMKFPMAQGLSVNVNTFSDYGGGVDDNKHCSPDSGHSMVLVGSGRQDGQEYWLYRNSYGPTWGEKGYYKMNKKAKNCLLDDGMGYFLRPKEGEQTVFDLRGNSYNDPKYVMQRYYDVMHGKYIAKNPYNKDDDEVDDSDAIVTPPPSKYY